MRYMNLLTDLFTLITPKLKSFFVDLLKVLFKNVDLYRSVQFFVNLSVVGLLRSNNI